ncbi:50S ribosomal protein L13 [Candidatus Woesearchaeota archaeon]|nr:50S ribosomal protein L13 [Candidatus Woesearchaeota archaeon]
MIVDAKDLIVGRLATVVSKKALMGEKIDIVNCEKAIITGKKTEIYSRLKKKVDRGSPLKGPFFQAMPDRFVRRVIRGMLPYDQYKGKIAYKRIMCHIGVPEEFRNQKVETIKNANISNSTTLAYLTVGEICKHLRK